MSTSAINPVRRPLRVLIIEDYEEDALLLERHLSRAGYAVHTRQIQTPEEFSEALAETLPWELVIADYTLPSFGARAALQMLQESGADVPFIIVSGTIDEVSAVNAMRAGAHDYVLKGSLDRLLPAIERELADAERRRERVRTESELRIVQKRFSATFNQAAVGMAHTGTDGRFFLVNQRLGEMLGSPLESILALHMQDYLLASERNVDETLFAELLAGKRTGYRVEHSLLRADGTTFPAQLTASLIQTDGLEHPSVLWVVEDITARKTAERETAELMRRLINSERLAAAGRMANTLAHEINNPLEALTNLFYLLSTHDLATNSREIVDIAERELERVGHITRSTLSFYRKIPGRTLDLYDLLDEVMQLFRSRVTQHNIQIVSQFQPDTRNVHYDPSLRQVFANLVANALEAMENRGGHLVMRAKVVDGHAVVTVADDGHGIDRSVLPSIFEPFFTTKGERGTGLGLWVTRGIVEEQGGRLQLRSCTSGPRRGTTIRIILPVSATVAPAADVPRQESPALVP